MASIDQLERKVLELERRLNVEAEEANRLMAKSNKVLDIAKNAYKLDGYGFIWAFDPNNGAYYKTNMRVMSPEVADRVIRVKHLADGCVTSEKIADKAIDRSKMTDDVINELRQIDVVDVLVGELLDHYYTKEQVDQLLIALGLDEYATMEWVEQQEYLTQEDVKDKADKATTYTKEQVQALVRALRKYELVPVTVLPDASEDTTGKIFLIPNGEDPSLKDQWVTVTNTAKPPVADEWDNIINLGSIHKSRLESIVQNLGLGTYIYNVVDTLTSVAYVYQVTRLSMSHVEPIIPRKVTQGQLSKDKDGKYYIVDQDGEWVKYHPTVTYEWSPVGTVHIDFDNYYTKGDVDANFLKKSFITVQTETTVTIVPNVLNKWANPVSQLIITLAPGENGVADEYMLEFTVGSDNFQWQCDGIRWSDGGAPDFENGYIYQISIVNGLAIVASWEGTPVNNVEG